MRPFYYILLLVFVTCSLGQDDELSERDESLTTIAPSNNDTESDEEEVGTQLDLEFTFRNLGERCLLEDNYEIYSEYVELRQKQRLSLNITSFLHKLLVSKFNLTLNLNTTEGDNYRRLYGQGRICHPKYMCVQDGQNGLHCDCRPGFTFEIDRFFASHCRVQATYQCHPSMPFYSCARNLTCEELATGQRPQEIPGPYGQIILSLSREEGRVHWCVCPAGQTCPRRTEGQVLAEFFKQERETKAGGVNSSALLTSTLASLELILLIGPTFVHFH